jgi:hypothetical protein
MKMKEVLTGEVKRNWDVGTIHVRPRRDRREKKS